MRRLLATTLAALMAASSVAASAGAVQAAPTTIHAQPGAFAPVQYRGDNRDNNRGGNYRGADRGPNRDAFRDRGYWDRRNGRGYYDRTYRNTRRDDTSAIAAGFLGFVLGAAIAGSPNDRTYARGRLSDSSWVTNCSRRYRSFDRSSGTYLGNDGYRHYCR